MQNSIQNDEPSLEQKVSRLSHHSRFSYSMLQLNPLLLQVSALDINAKPFEPTNFDPSKFIICIRY